MRGRLWLNYFISAVVAEEPSKKNLGGRDWTEFMRGIMDRVAEKMNCLVVRLRPGDKESSGEYLNIDVLFIDNAEYDLNKESKWDPFVLPRAAVELENRYNRNKIAYCLWKLLCIRVPISVLVCCQPGARIRNVPNLKQHLEHVVWQGSLMKGTDGDLLIIIGDGSVAREAPWGEYFTVFEWRNDRLEKIEGLTW